MAKISPTPQRMTKTNPYPCQRKTKTVPRHNSLLFADQELETKANYVFHRLVEDWWPPKEDKAGDNTTELRAALRDHYEPSLKELVREAQGSDLWRWYRTTYRSVFSFLREYLPIAHNYPIVTVTFESSRQSFARTRRRAACRPFACQR